MSGHDYITDEGRLIKTLREKLTPLAENISRRGWDEPSVRDWPEERHVQAVSEVP
jgi:hypothetical protein